MSRFTKDPAAVLDYAYSWAAWVAEDETIDTAAVTITSGPPVADPPTDPLVVDSVTHTDTVVTAWLSGGEVGDTYHLMCHIETNQDRIDERTIRITIRER